MSPMEEIKQMFFVECDEHLETLQDGLEGLKENPEDNETINAVFRAVHSIKGGAAAFGLTDLVGFAHAFETVLHQLRSNLLACSEDVLRILLRSADLLNNLVTAGRNGSPAPTEQMLAQIAQLSDLAAETERRTAEPEAVAAAEPPAAAEAAAPEADAGSHVFRIVFRPFASVFERGGEPVLLFRDLRRLGEARISCDLSGVPSLDHILTDESYLRWTVDIETTASEVEILEIFDFVDGDCELAVSPLAPMTEAPEQESPEKEAPAPEKETPAPETESVAAAVPAAQAAPAPAPAQTPAPAGPPKKGGDGPASKSAAPATVRVDLERVDRLINLVGELVINQAMLSQSLIGSNLANSSGATTGLDELKQLTREIQESVLAIRAQPVKSIFQRMARIVREVTDATGKKVNFVTEGEMTEVDKTVIEGLADPLTHMIRNAVDHGLESAERRAAAGKPAEGLVRLTAEHRSGRVLIEISDDGAGIDRERVRQTAINKGLIASDSVLSAAEIDNLLFLPGFSTAKAVSDLSGRGVGMDVVKRSITSLGGRIAITSVAGQGTTFSISLPLTMAILDGMIVSVGEETVVVPLSAILEMLKPSAKQLFQLGVEGFVVQVRGEYVPIIDVGYALGFGEATVGYQDRVMLLVETSDGERRALAVNAIQEQRQVVIKGLESNCGTVPGIAAATILGDGRIALILDTDAIVTEAARAPKARFALAG